MGLIRGISNGIGWAGRKIAMRSRWLARRLWLVMVADAALTSRRHWKRLDRAERDRLVKLARKSRGRPDKNLSARERREASRLLDKFGHLELGGELAGIVLPFRPLSRLATRMLARGQAEKQRKAEAGLERQAAEDEDPAREPARA